MQFLSMVEGKREVIKSNKKLAKGYRLSVPSSTKRLELMVIFLGPMIELGAR